MRVGWRFHRARGKLPTLRYALVLAILLGCRQRDRAGRARSESPRPAAVPAPALPRFTEHATAADALKVVLAEKPRVLGFGEYHAMVGAPRVASAIERFTGMLDLLAPYLSDLVVETWIAQGKCGKAEAKVFRDVPRDTARPPDTPNELVRLATRARALGVQPHALTLSCRDYESLVGKDGAKDASVDYEKMLSLITRELLRVSSAAVKKRNAKQGSRPVVAIYGGALHNDLYPYDATKAWSYATQLAARVPGYVEVDLYVPELVQDRGLLALEPWYPLLGLAPPDRVLLIERAPRSYILLLQKGLAPARP